MKKIIYFGLVLITITYLGYSWVNLSPTIKPEEIVLNARLINNNYFPSPSLVEKDGYIMELSIQRQGKLPLSTYRDKAYFHNIYPYVSGLAVADWDFFRGRDERGDVIGHEGYSFGADGRTVKLSAQALYEKGLLNDTSDATINDLYNKLLGFTYLKNDYPIKLRVYLTPRENQEPLKEANVIYTHYEKKWGKDLSWYKLIPVQINKS